MATKTNQVKVEIEGTTAVFKSMIRGEDGEWLVQEAVSYAWHELPEHVRDFTAAYGVRALLQDRASDFRKHGTKEYMKAIGEYFELFMTGQLKKATVRASSIDRALVHLVAELKEKSVIWAEAQLKHAPKELRESLALAHADRLAVIRGELEHAVADEEALADLL